MSKSYILSSQKETFINTKLKEIRESLQIEINSADYLIIEPDNDKQSLGVDKTRKLKKWMTVKPYSGKNKLAVIPNAELLTIEAQNSILKELEEPNEGCHTVLTTFNQHLLLPTIQSRCEIIHDVSQCEQTDSESLLGLTKVEQFQYISSVLDIKDNFIRNQQIKTLLRNLLIDLEQALLEDMSDQRIRENIDLAEKTYTMVLHNTSRRLALENLIINLQ